MSSHPLTAFTTLLLLAAPAQPAGSLNAPPRSPEAIQVADGRLLLGDQQVLDRFSLVQSKFSFLFFYLPDRGLLAISNRPFPGAQAAGVFAGDRLELDFEGLAVRLESSVPILQSSEATAWVALDPKYSLEVDSVLVGYGDNLEAPKAWERYVHSNR